MFKVNIIDVMISMKILSKISLLSTLTKLQICSVPSLFHLKIFSLLGRGNYLSELDNHTQRVARIHDPEIKFN